MEYLFKVYDAQDIKITGTLLASYGDKFGALWEIYKTESGNIIGRYVNINPKKSMDNQYSKIVDAGKNPQILFDAWGFDGDMKALYALAGLDAARRIL